MIPRRKAEFSPADARGTVTPLPVSSSGRVRRRHVYRPLTDAVVQGLISVMSATLFAASAWALRSNGLVVAGTIFVALAVGCIAAFLLIVGRAMERDKLVEYWSDRRALRLELRRTRAELAMLARTLEMLDEGEGSSPEAMSALAALGDAAQRALAARQEDVAVLLVLEREGRCAVLHSAVPPGSHFSVPLSGNSRVVAGNVENALGRLAPHQRSFRVEMEGATLWVGVLSETELGDADDGLLVELPLCFGLVARHWSRPVPDSAVRLHPVG